MVEDSSSVAGISLCSWVLYNKPYYKMSGILSLIFIHLNSIKSLLMDYAILPCYFSS